jgi:hypothetical protein
MRFAAPIWSSAPHSEGWQSLAIAPDAQQATAAANAIAIRRYNMMNSPKE